MNKTSHLPRSCKRWPRTITVRRSPTGWVRSALSSSSPYGSRPRTQKFMVGCLLFSEADHSVKSANRSKYSDSARYRHDRRPVVVAPGTRIGHMSPTSQKATLPARPFSLSFAVHECRNMTKHNSSLSYITFAHSESYKNREGGPDPKRNPICPSYNRCA